MTSMLKELLGDDQEKRNQAQDFVSRYEDGPPTEGFSDDEAIQHYDEVAGELSPEEYEQFATEAFERMSPQQRQEFGQMLMQHGNENGLPVSADTRYEDPRQLAQLTSQFQQQPIGLAGLFGMGGGGGLGGGLGGMLGGFGGGQQYGSFPRQGGMGGMIGNPIARAAIGGIASMAFRQLLGRR